LGLKHFGSGLNPFSIGSVSVVDPESGSTSNKHQDKDPHKKDMLDPELDPDPHQFADDKPKCMEYEPF
jgi:hypothetical protein